MLPNTLPLPVFRSEEGIFETLEEQLLLASPGTQRMETIQGEELVVRALWELVMDFLNK